MRERDEIDTIGALLGGGEGVGLRDRAIRITGCELESLWLPRTADHLVHVTWRLEPRRILHIGCGHATYRS